MQYSNLNYYVFKGFKPECKIPIRRLMMMIPFAVTGFTLGAFKIINIIKNYKYIIYIFSSITFIFADYFNIFSNLTEFNGMQLNVLSICLIFIFSLFSFEKNINKYIKIFIEYSTRYTAGIYYLHTTVAYYLKYYISYIRKGNIGGLIIIYMTTYIICHLGMKLVKNNKGKNLFI